MAYKRPVVRTRPTEDDPTHAPMRPHALGWAADYADRTWFSRSRRQKLRDRNEKRRQRRRSGVAF
jgi:hypothetical protein